MDEQSSPQPRLHPPGAITEPTVVLFERARDGDADAENRLFRRYLPRMTAWARGRLPPFARGLTDTTDLVQDVALATFRRLRRISPHRTGVLAPYLREALANRVRDEIRRASRRPCVEELHESAPDRREQSPFDAAARRERHEAYLAALARLRSRDQQAIVARLELGYSWDQIALAFDWPTPDAAMVATRRALERLRMELHHGG